MTVGSGLLIVASSLCTEFTCVEHGRVRQAEAPQCRTAGGAIQGVGFVQRVFEAEM